MNTKYWQIIRDDTKKTYEVCGVESNTNHFTNSIVGMQRAGMRVSGETPPVTNKFSHKGAVVVRDYKLEEGLWTRLMKEYVDKAKEEFFE